MAYDIGTSVELDAAFTNLAGVPANPTAVVCTVKKPDGTSTTPTATSTVVGTWTASVTVDQAGIWRYRFAGTGAVVVAEEGRFLVETQQVP